MFGEKFIDEQGDVVTITFGDTDLSDIPLEYFRLDVLCDPLTPVVGSMSLQEPPHRD